MTDTVTLALWALNAALAMLVLVLIVNLRDLARRHRNAKHTLDRVARQRDQARWSLRAHGLKVPGQ